MMQFYFFFQVDRGSHGASALEVKTLAVLLPCREKNSKVTKMWLRRLQQYLYYHYKNKESAMDSSEESGNHENSSVKKPRFKILTLFSCKARERLALMERPDLAGILSFEPRPSTQPPGQCKPSAVCLQPNFFRRLLMMPGYASKSLGTSLFNKFDL